MKKNLQVIALFGFLCAASVALAQGAFNPCPPVPTPSCCNMNKACCLIAGCFKIGSLQTFSPCCQPILSVCGCKFSICPDESFCPSQPSGGSANQYIINFLTPFCETPAVIVSSSDGNSVCVGSAPDHIVIRTGSGSTTWFVVTQPPVGGQVPL